MADVVEDLTKSRGNNLEPVPQAPPARRSPVKFIVLAMLALAAVAGGWAWLHFRDRVSSDDAQVDAHIVAIAPKISGNVIAVLVNDNQAVKAGDVLVRIDPRDYQARVDMARAALVQAESQVTTSRTMVPMTNESTQSGVSGASAQLSDARAELDRAQLSYEQAASSDIAVSEAKVRSKQASNERAQADLARMKPLLDKEEISRLQYDSYQAAGAGCRERAACRPGGVEFGAEERQHPQVRGRRGPVESQSGAVPGGGLAGQSQAGGRAPRRDRHRVRRRGSRARRRSAPPN